MSRVQGMRAIPKADDGPFDVIGVPDEQDVSFALMACIFGAVVRPRSRAGPRSRDVRFLCAPTQRLTLRARPAGSP